MNSNDLSEDEIRKRAEAILKKMKEENLTAKEALGLNETFLEEMYSLAHAHYERGNYKESISLFQFLTGVSPNTYKYVLGLAANYHQIGQYEDAIEGFHLALTLDPSNPTPTFYIADSFLRLGKEKEAMELFEIVAEIDDRFKEYRDIKEKSILILDALRKKHSSD